MAGILALFDQNHSSALSSFDTVSDLYKVSTSAYHDVTTANNGSYSAQSAYDLVTGLGSPKASSLVPYINQTK